MSKTKRYSPRDLLTMAVQIEKNGEAYYLRMAEQSQQPEARKMFEYLAGQERGHVVDFQKIIESLGSDADRVPEAYREVAVEGYLEALANGKVFPNTASLDEATRSAKKIRTDAEALLHALQFEKDAIIFFGEVLAMLPGDHPDRKAVEELIRQEKVHISRLHTMVAQLQAEKEN